MLNTSPLWCTKCTKDICPNHMNGTSEKSFERSQWCIFTSFCPIRFFFCLNFYFIFIFLSQYRAAFRFQIRGADGNRLFMCPSVLFSKSLNSGVECVGLKPPQIFVFHLLSFFKKREHYSTIQGGTLFKGGHYF